MAFNKTKALESAIKLLNQGKLAQAITEYQHILRQDPKDQATLMTLGDLFVRQGEPKQATEYFERLAQVFLGDGFNSKAIAIYKKIAKLAPSETQPLEQLADLYVQQGVLSEARPLYLQLAEIHMKADRAPRAVEALRRLLEVEPENQRVQMRLAELYQAIGQKKEAAQIFLEGAQRSFDRGDQLETLKLVDRAIETAPGNPAAVLLKARALAGSGKAEPAIALLEQLPDAQAGAETTKLLMDVLLKCGKLPRAVELARKVFARGPEHHALAHGVAVALLEGGEPDVALELLGEIRIAMFEAGEYELLSQALASASERMPTRLEPLEWLVDLFRRSSDSFRLPDAIARLAEASAVAGKLEQAEALFAELLERDPEDDSLLQRLNQVREKLGLEPRAPSELPRRAESSSVAPAETAPGREPPLDDTSQRYVTQALTDVDLFSSYGLTQKAIHLLETVLQRVPRHTPTLERLLDLSLGAGNDRRTAELSAQLEQIHFERGDQAGADRFAELRRRFQRVAGLTAEDLAVAAQAVHRPAPMEFAIPAAETAAAPPAPMAQAPAVEEIKVQEEVPVPDQPEVRKEEQEVDLTEEWAAISQEVAEPEAVPEAEAVLEAAEPQAMPVTPAEEAADFELELVPSAASTEEAQGAMTQDQFLSELVAEVEGLEPQAPAAEPAVSHRREKARPAADLGSVEQLREVFQEFRDELGEMGEEDEDLETHYNLGIAYREMGLLEEAIGEFQKVAKAVQEGRPFRYAMQCSTLLGLIFMAKEDPKIASLWYQRALETPGLDQESILALRYDLGVAQDLAGDAAAALETFRQVYAINIDYRDVAERIAALQKR